VIRIVDIWSQAFWTSKSHYGYYANILGCSQKSMQILSTISKVNLRRFYESFTSNKWCESYVRDIQHISIVSKVLFKMTR
jgi:hypothetical protein